MKSSYLIISIVGIAVIMTVLIIIKVTAFLHKRSQQKKYITSKISEIKGLLDDNNINEAEDSLKDVQSYELASNFNDELYQLEERIKNLKSELRDKISKKIDETTLSLDENGLKSINDLIASFGINDSTVYKYNEKVSELSKKIKLKETISEAFDDIRELVANGEISQAEDKHIELANDVNRLGNESVEIEYNKIQDEIIDSVHNPFVKYLLEKRIAYLYHFTDIRNLNSIKAKGGLYSWDYCGRNGISIPSPGGDQTSRSLDLRHNLQNYVRLSFCDDHPMAYSKWNRENRATTIVLLKIDLRVILLGTPVFSDMNATDNKCHHGTEIEDLKRIDLDATQENYVSRNIRETDDSGEEKVVPNPKFKLHQAEVLIKDHVPLKFIMNIDDPIVLFDPENVIGKPVIPQSPSSLSWMTIGDLFK